LMINLVSRPGPPWIFLATFSWPEHGVLAAQVPFSGDTPT
jgi:hypothetical protein